MSGDTARGPGQGRPVGAHVPVSGGLAAGGLAYARQIGAEAIQVFVANPRGWAAGNGDPREDAALTGHLAATGLPLYVHAPYLINPGSPDAGVRERSAAALAHSLRRGAQLGAVDVVVHTGSAVAGSRGDGLRRAREMLLPLLDSLPGDGPGLLLEPLAGQAQILCATIADLEPYLDALDWHPRVGVCLDTCHAFAAGHDLAAPGGVDAVLGELAAVLGRHPGPPGGRLRLIHANDSKDGCGSRRDRHENIGAGKIGTAAFADLLRHPATAGIPFIAETPGPRRAHADDVATLVRLRSPAAARPAISR